MELTLCRSLGDKYSGVFIKTTVWVPGQERVCFQMPPRRSWFFPHFSYWFSILSTVFLSKSGDCSKNRANHHDNHKHSRPPHVFLRHAQTRRCRFHVQVKVSDATRGPDLNGREQKKRREEGGVTGVTLRPLGVDLRSGPGAELEPPTTHPVTEKWKRIWRISPAERYNNTATSCCEKEEQRRCNHGDVGIKVRDVAGLVSVVRLLKTWAWVKAACVWTCDTERGTADPAHQAPPPPPSPPEWPRSKESKKMLATRETRISAGRCWVQIQSRQVRCGILRQCCPLPRSSSPPPPPHPSSHLSLHLLLFFASASSQVWLLQPIRSTPRRCVGTSGPLCGPASPSWGQLPRGRGPDGQTGSRAARVDGGACRTRSLEANRNVVREEATSLPASLSLACANVDAIFDGFSDVLSCKQQQVAFCYAPQRQEPSSCCTSSSLVWQR